MVTEYWYEELHNILHDIKLYTYHLTHLLYDQIEKYRLSRNVPNITMPVTVVQHRTGLS